LSRRSRASSGTATTTLLELGAVDERGELTGVGRDLARLPIDPRIGRMILGGQAETRSRRCW